MKKMLTAAMAFASILAASPARVIAATSTHPKPYTAKDFLWDPDVLPRRYAPVVIATVNHIHHDFAGCAQMDTASMAMADEMPSRNPRFFVWCSYDPPGPQSFKVYFDARGHILKREGAGQ